ncbi:fibrous sheath CABYR-binding protein-like [Anopheles bellator]|uniref:fibrous sheath CABYR-binding protein-like n=1 Tax=Anopheles bellator TaxID=139047 RepID=UPI002647E263|nr:fibrous sheath CABYR-binding protein-like [Anopheles bellator]
MDFVFRALFVQFLALGLLVPLVRPQTGGTDCNGKDYLCLDDVRFQLCVDYGNGRPTTVNDEVQQCPAGTFCSNSGHFECDSFVPPSTTAAPQVGDAEPATEPTESAPEVVEEEATLPPAEEVAPEAPEATTVAPEVAPTVEATEVPEQTQEPQESTVEPSEPETEASSDQPATTEAETETEAAPESSVPPTESSSQSSEPEEPEVTEGETPEATDAPAPEQTTATPEASPEPEPQEPTEQVTEAEEEATAAPTTTSTTDEPATEGSPSTGTSDEPTDSDQASEVPSTEPVTDEAEVPEASPTESAPETTESVATSEAPAGSGSGSGSDESGSSGSGQDSEEPSGESAGSGSNEATTVAAPVAVPEPFVCQTAGRFPHPNDCHKYFICFWLPFGLYNLEQSCLPGFAYNPTLERCTADQSVCFPGQFTCTAPGRFPDPASPTSYFWCVWNVLGGYVQYNLQCPLGQVFNPFRGRCAFVVAGRSLPVGEPLPVGEEEAVAAAAAAEPAFVEPLEPVDGTQAPALKVKFECLEEGTFADPNNCSRYFVCTLKKLDKFKKSKFKCVTGERFDALVGGCVPDVDALCE